ncbi:hypothetical protein QCK34_004563, partial [Enterobacter asburiae]|nr:hypothetical protein [Enterobacter asburiae]
NHGDIVLDAEDGVTSDATGHQLVGMGAVNGGLAINAKDGVITINSGIGQVFYVDDKSNFLNYGLVVWDEALTPTPGATHTLFTDGAVLAATGESKTINKGLVGSEDGLTAVTVSNNGTVSGGPLVIGDLGTLNNNADGT